MEISEMPKIRRSGGNQATTSSLQPVLLVGTQMAVGGAQKVLLQLASMFHQNGFPVTAAFFYDRDNLADQWQAAHPFPILVLGNWKKESSLLQKAGSLASSLVRLFSLMRRSRFHSVMAFTHHSSLLALPLAWLADIPVRVASHRGRILGIPAWQERAHAQLVNSSLVTALVAVTQAVRRQALEEGIHPAKIVVIPNGVQIQTVPLPEVQRLRSEAGVASQGFLLLSAGRLWEEKGHIHLVRAMPDVLNSIPAAVLALAGDGACRDDLQKEAVRLGVAEHVLFLGIRSDVAAWMAAADLFILPSNSEGMPNALLEAMAAGTAVIATRVGGVPDIIQHGQNGFLIPPADPQALASAMINLAHNPELRTSLGRNAENTARSEFQLEKMFERYQQLLTAVPQKGTYA